MSDFKVIDGRAFLAILAVMRLEVLIVNIVALNVQLLLGALVDLIVNLVDWLSRVVAGELFNYLDVVFVDDAFAGGPMLP